MRLRSLAVLVAVALAAPAPATARGERSYRLSEVRETVPASSRVVRTADRSRPADRISMRHDAMAVGRGIVAFTVGGRVCGFDDRTGARRWCSAAGTAPAYAGGEVAAGAAQHPLLLSDRAWLALGPHRGTVHVQRLDGIWAMRSDERQVHARRVATSQVEMMLKGSAIVGRVAYFAFADGRVRGVDVADGHVVLDATLPGAPSEIESSAAHVFFACEEPYGERPRWHVVAFARPDAP